MAKDRWTGRLAEDEPRVCGPAVSAFRGPPGRAPLSNCLQEEVVELGGCAGNRGVGRCADIHLRPLACPRPLQSARNHRLTHSLLPPQVSLPLGERSPLGDIQWLRQQGACIPGFQAETPHLEEVLEAALTYWGGGCAPCVTPAGLATRPRPNAIARWPSWALDA